MLNNQWDSNKICYACKCRILPHSAYEYDPVWGYLCEADLALKDKIDKEGQENDNSSNEDHRRHTGCRALP